MWAVVLLLLLNYIDAAMTLVAVSRGRAVELNPAMAVILDHGTVLFLAVKVIPVSLAIVFLGQYSRRGTLVLILIYALLIVYELLGLGVLQ